MKTLFKILPWFCLAIFATEIIAVLLPKKDKEFHAREFGRLPVLLNGRIQPFDSVAHNALLQIRSTGSVPLEGNGADGSWGEWTELRNNLKAMPLTERKWWQFNRHPKKLKSTEWLLEVMFKSEVADTRPIFLIHHPDLLSELKLGEKGIEKSALRYYTYEELTPVIDEIGEQGSKAGEVKDAQRTTYQRQVLKLSNAVMLYQRLKNSIQPQDTTDFSKVIADYQSSLASGIAAFRAQQAGEKADQAALEKLGRLAKRFDAMGRFAYPLVIPPVDPAVDRNAWATVGTSLFGAIQENEIHPAVGFFARIATAYGQNNAAEFNSAVASYKNWLAPKFSKELKKGRAEFYFNDVKAFLHATIIYLTAFLLSCGALLTFGSLPNLSESLRRSAYFLILLAIVVHTFGLIFRMVLEGRPPVTNLYSSAVFIGWGACILGIILERIYKLGLGSAVAAFAGFITLLIAHNLALGGDTMEMLQAVLDTNFWLATHVVVVTLGYASTFVAGTLAIAYIVLGVFTPLLSTKVGREGAAAKGGDNLGKALAKMAYAIVCFATLFSFTGTVLGGIWADQSWGRFWGWDPKENGALLIVIWNVVILHARWGGLVRERGLMNLAVFGNIVTSFSWFGVNMLGIGLHSYGFMDAAFKWLMLFVGTQVAIILLGLLPLNVWKSFRNTLPTPATPSGPSGGKRKISPSPARA